MKSPLSASHPPERRAALHVCLGTRPEIIKMAPVIEALNRRGLETRVIHTGQHRELAWPLYRHFGIEPAVELSRAPEDRSLSALSAGLIRGLEQTVTEDPPQAMLVHGDTTSAAMAAMVAFYRKIPVAHIEAGLRSHRIDDPFPEEFNRSLITRIAHWHFAPSETAVRNLYAEGVEPEKTFLVGNTIVDATIAAVNRLKRTGAADASTAGGDAEQGVTPRDDAPTAEPKKRLVLVTLHRRENWGEAMAGLARAVFALVQAHPELTVVWPLHANPALAQLVRDQARQHSSELLQRCHLIAPLEYPDLIELLAQAWLVITDSGGLQEEACALQVPVLVARQGTERPELIEIGAGRLVGTDPLNLIREFERLWRDPERHAAMRSVRHPYGDGRAAERIATVLAQALHEGSGTQSILARRAPSEALTFHPECLNDLDRSAHATRSPMAQPLNLSGDWPQALGPSTKPRAIRTAPGLIPRQVLASLPGDPR